MGDYIDPKIAKLLRWAQKTININSPYSYDKEIIVDIANYICKEFLPFDKGLFIYYSRELNFPEETINVFVKEIEKAMKRKSHPIKVIIPKHILQSTL